MKTVIDLDGRLLAEAFKRSRMKTKEALIHQAIKEFVEKRRRLNLLDLFGKIEFFEGYNYKSMR